MNDPQRPPNQPTKVTLEDLLRLKRAERPPVNFWADFERQMRTKQLAAIVRKDPWWRTWRNVFASSARFHLPLGATAMLALAFVTVREFRRSTPVEAGLPIASSPTPSVSNRAEPVTVAPAAASAELASDYSEASQVSSAPVVQTASLTQDAPSPTELAQLSVSSSVQPSESEEGGSTPEMIGFSAGPTASSRPSLSQTSRTIAANLAAAEADGAELLPVLARSRSFDSSMQDKSGSVEPLSQVSTPRDARRARLLASAVATDMHSPEHSAARSRERITSQLSEQSLYDSITRLGVAGNRLSIKF